MTGPYTIIRPTVKTTDDNHFVAVVVIERKHEGVLLETTQFPDEDGDFLTHDAALDRAKTLVQLVGDQWEAIDEVD